MHFIADFSQKAVMEVFKTMLSLDLVPCQEVEGPEALTAPPFNGIMGSVSMAGKITGCVHMCYPGDAAFGVVEKMFGARPAGLGEAEVSDLIGELANMVAGDMKRRASKMGYDGWLSTPVVVHGENVTLEAKNVPVASFSTFRIPELKTEIGVRVFAKLD